MAPASQTDCPKGKLRERHTPGWLVPGLTEVGPAHLMPIRDAGLHTDLRPLDLRCYHRTTRGYAHEIRFGTFRIAR